MRGEDYAKGQIVKGNPVQGRYSKGAHAFQTSEDVKKVQACVRDAMKGESFDSIEDANDALEKAAEQC
jgi:hypothetical protein